MNAVRVVSITNSRIFISIICVRRDNVYHFNGQIIDSFPALFPSEEWEKSIRRGTLSEDFCYKCFKFYSYNVAFHNIFVLRLHQHCCRANIAFTTVRRYRVCVKFPYSFPFSRGRSETNTLHYQINRIFVPRYQERVFIGRHGTLSLSEVP